MINEISNNETSKKKKVTFLDSGKGNFPVNIQSFFERKTIEFRMFKSTMDIEELKIFTEIAKYLHGMLSSGNIKPFKKILAELPKDVSKYWLKQYLKYKDDIAFLDSFDCKTWGKSARWGWGTQ